MTMLNPAEGSVIVAAVDWLEGTLLGTVAQTIAIIAVASLGFMLLTGRVDWRRGVTVILGCFIVFGAKEIALSLRSVAGDDRSDEIVSRPVYPPTVKYPRPQQVISNEVEL